jgi:hypothetical protein
VEPFLHIREKSSHHAKIINCSVFSEFLQMIRFQQCLHQLLTTKILEKRKSENFGLEGSGSPNQIHGIITPSLDYQKHKRFDLALLWISWKSIIFLAIEISQFLGLKSHLI